MRRFALLDKPSLASQDGTLIVSPAMTKN